MSKGKAAWEGGLHDKLLGAPRESHEERRARNPDMLSATSARWKQVAAAGGGKVPHATLLAQLREVGRLAALQDVYPRILTGRLCALWRRGLQFSWRLSPHVEQVL